MSGTWEDTLSLPSNFRFSKYKITNFKATLFVMTYHKKIIKFISREPDKILYRSKEEFYFEKPEVSSDFDDPEFITDENLDVLNYVNNDLSEYSKRGNCFVSYFINETFNFRTNTLSRVVVEKSTELFDLPVVINAENSCSIHDFSYIQHLTRNDYNASLKLVKDDKITVSYQYVIFSQSSGIGLTEINYVESCYKDFAEINFQREIYFYNIMGDEFLQVSQLFHLGDQTGIFMFCLNRQVEPRIEWLGMPKLINSVKYNIHGRSFRSTEPISVDDLKSTECSLNPVVELISKGYLFYPNKFFYPVPIQARIKYPNVAKRPLRCIREPISYKKPTIKLLVFIVNTSRYTRRGYSIVLPTIKLIEMGLLGPSQFIYKKNQFSLVLRYIASSRGYSSKSSRYKLKAYLLFINLEQFIVQVFVFKLLISISNIIEFSLYN